MKNKYLLWLLFLFPNYKNQCLLWLLCLGNNLKKYVYFAYCEISVYSLYLYSLGRQPSSSRALSRYFYSVVLISPYVPVCSTSNGPHISRLWAARAMPGYPDRSPYKWHSTCQSWTPGFFGENRKNKQLWKWINRCSSQIWVQLRRQQKTFTNVSPLKVYLMLR